MGREVYRLCYVSEGWAFFTTQKLEDQWGDDWDDAPYQHNAGDPYGAWRNEEKWKIVKVAFDSLMSEAKDLTTQYVSVKDINEKKLPWLCDKYGNSTPRVEIWAGTTLEEFKRKIWATGGKIFVEEPPMDGLDLAAQRVDTTPSEGVK